MDSKTFNNSLAAGLDMPSRKTAEMIEALAQVLQESARTLTSIAIPSFGTFVPTKASETIVTDRSTGKRLLLPPQISVEFHAAAMLRKKLTGHE